MTKESLGYVRLVWTCPSCGSKNPGPQKTCGGCGAPQPDNVQFEQAAQEELITDAAEISRAKAGPDVHCAFCGARNPAGTENCTQCGANLAEAEARASGQVMGAHRDKPAQPVPCPSCGAPNPATALECSQCGASLSRPKPSATLRRRPVARPAAGSCSPIVWVILGGVLLLVAVIVIFSLRTRETVARVQDVSWTRIVPIQALVPVTYDDWREGIPSDAVIGTCVQKVHHTQDSPAPNSDKVCGTPYTVDTGAGYGEVVQDCEYQVYADWCEYQVDEWRVVDSVSLTGRDLSARWPALQLKQGQREGEREQEYIIYFDADGKSFSYRTRDEDTFSRFEIGSRWVLKVDGLGAVKSAEPAD